MVRQFLVDHAAGRIGAAERSELEAHLAGCASCRRAAAVEAELGAALSRLPHRPVPPELGSRLEALVRAATPPVAASPVDRGTAAERATAARPADARGRLWGWVAPFASACVAAALVLVVGRATSRGPVATPISELVTEAVNDHLRVVASTHPVEIESGGIHQVKPWFTGRLDFAPRVSFSGDADFPLVGGSVGYFRDRKAAVFVFKRRLHTVTLLVFPPEGLPWPKPGPAEISLGHLTVAQTTSRGFSVLLWQDGGLGYALVSDVNVSDLETLALKINGV